jgi:hypothetical protein
MYWQEIMDQLRQLGIADNRIEVAAVSIASTLPAKARKISDIVWGEAERWRLASPSDHSQDYQPLVSVLLFLSGREEEDRYSMESCA